MKFKTAYSVKKRQQIDFTNDLGKTIQEQHPQTQIQNILEKHRRTGLITHVQKHEPQFGEFSQFDFQEMKNKVVEITEMFESLPAQDRKTFDNDPALYLDWLADAKNREDLSDGIIGNETKEPDIPTISEETNPTEKSVEKE